MIVGHVKDADGVLADRVGVKVRVRGVQPDESHILGLGEVKADEVRALAQVVQPVCLAGDTGGRGGHVAACWGHRCLRFGLQPTVLGRAGVADNNADSFEFHEYLRGGKSAPVYRPAGRAQRHRMRVSVLQPMTFPASSRTRSPGTSTSIRPRMLLWLATTLDTM